MSERTPSTVLVQPLDLSGTYPAALEYINGHGKPLATEVHVSPRWGIVETPRGLYALCTEGVGNSRPITDEEPLDVDVYVSKSKDDGEKQFISMYPSASLKLGPEELRSYASGDKVPLHDWIRSFGARLEANYSGWRRALEAA